MKNSKKTGLTPDEVAELARAKAEGRLVVLPCKIGTKVYRIIDKLIKEVYILDYSLKNNLIVFDSGATDIGFFGKTVFLIREEAEAALKGEK